jgi:recombination protein RecA
VTFHPRPDSLHPRPRLDELPAFVRRGTDRGALGPGSERASRSAPDGAPADEALANGAPADAPRWCLREVEGRLVELSSWRGGGSLSLAFDLVREAQLRGELAAWVGGRESCFFPPDVAAAGVDLDALVVARLPREQDLAAAADGFARSGAFALIVLDLAGAAPSAHVGSTAPASTALSLPAAAQSRLLGLAQKHRTAVVCLTDKPRETASLSSLVSLRGEARLRTRSAGPQRFECELSILKDKRRSRPWRHLGARRGPPGLR